MGFKSWFKTGSLHAVLLAEGFAEVLHSQEAWKNSQQSMHSLVTNTEWTNNVAVLMQEEIEPVGL